MLLNGTVYSPSTLGEASGSRKVPAPGLYAENYMNMYICKISISSRKYDIPSISYTAASLNKSVLNEV